MLVHPAGFFFTPSMRYPTIRVSQDNALAVNVAW